MSISMMKKVCRDELTRDYILPVKILYASEGIENPEVLLRNTEFQPRVGEMEVLKASTENGKKAAFLIDFGTEFSGGVRITTRYAKDNQDVKVRLRFGESVSESMTASGTKNSGNYHSTREMAVSLSRLGCTAWGQTGFRFLYVEVESEESFLEFMAIHGEFVYRDLPYLGSFQCNDDLINQIYDTCAYTVHVNMQSYLWDGIKRDRLVWIGDMHPEMLAIRTVFGYQEILDKSLRYVAGTNPIPQWPNHMATYGMWYLIILKDWYMYHGNQALVLELKDYWLPLLKQIMGCVHDQSPHLREEELESGFFFDWPTRDDAQASCAGVYALCSWSLEAGKFLCEITEEQEIADQCSVKKMLLREHQGFHHGRKQIAAMMSLTDHLSDSEAKEILTSGGGRGMSTFQSCYILKAVDKSADISTALCMMKEYYGAMLQAGATTFWEDFDPDWMKENASIEKLPSEEDYDIHGDNGKYCYIGFRHSLCHGWSAGPAAFLAENVLGVRILEPGCKKVSITPKLGNLEWIKGSYPTPLGVIEIEVRKNGEEISKVIRVPEGIEVV